MKDFELNTSFSTSAKIEKIGFISSVDALQITLIVLKLCKIIHWSWLLVLAPTWISIVIIVTIVLLESVFLKD